MLAHTGAIYSTVVTQNYTITGSGDGSITLWDNNEGEPDGVRLKTGGIGIHHMAATADGSTLVAIGFNGRVLVYDLAVLKQVEEIGDLAKVNNSWAVAIAFDSPLMVLSTITGDIKVFDLETYAAVSSFSPRQKAFGVSLDVSPAGKYAACGYEDGTLLVYNLKTQNLECSFSGHKSCIRAVKFSPDGSFLAASGDSKVIFIYQVTTGEHVYNLSGHEAWVFSLAWDIDSSADDELLLLSASHDGKIKLWSLDARKDILTIGDSTQPIFSLGWFKKGWGPGVIGGFSKGFVSVGVDKTIRWYRSASAGK